MCDENSMKMEHWWLVYSPWQCYCLLCFVCAGI